MKMAVIDCGTNTFNLLIIELRDDNSYEKLFNTRIPVRLGEDSINDGFIAEVPFMRGIDAISSLKHHLKKFAVQKVLAFATSAIREASNGEQFVKEVRELFDIDIEIIDGNHEAELIYYGTKEAVELDDRISLIMDIGGGSNEFILASKNRIFWKRSFMIGAARLLEKFGHSNPITQEEKEQITNYLLDQLQPLIFAAKDHPPHELIGSAGAFESIVEMINGELGGEPLSSERTEYNINLEHNRQIAEMVFNSTIEQRRNIRGLVPMRVDMMVVSCLMINFILDAFKFNKMRVSTYSLKEGALLDFINKQVEK
jgi:exopolyphosphatase/guanosine-5'-triphosphate,3'-diphosphate pyrophosphatase